MSPHACRSNLANGFGLPFFELNAKGLGVQAAFEVSPLPRHDIQQPDPAHNTCLVDFMGLKGFLKNDARATIACAH